MDNSFQLPPNFYTLTIGSIVDGETSKFSASVIQASITKMVPQSFGTKFMSGNSSYVYSDKMNQGSFEISGSYGVSGIAKVSAGISGYAGESQAQYKNGVTVNYNAIAWGGVEYINLGNLTVTQLINSMNKNCKQDIMSAFDKFIQVKEKLSTMGEDFDAILSGVYKNDQSELKTLLEAWITAVQRFKQQNGDGIVVGILWGGIGTVSMNMLSEQEETNLKFGGAAQFSFAGTNGSASVKATYDGSRSDKNAKVQVTIVSSHYGSCMQPIVQQWEEKLGANTWDNLFNKDIMSLAPALSGAVIPSNPPAFIAPEDDGVASKLGKIKNLDGLELLAKAQAFDEAKKKDKDLTLSHFLENAKKPASTEGLNELSNLITNNDVNIEPPTSSSSTGGGHSTLRNYAPLTSTLKSEEGTPHTTPTENQPQIEYCPIGIWVAKWADLFPWLAMGINNNVNADDIEKSLNLIKKRTLLQDFITLGNIYKAVAQAKLGIYPDRRNSEEDLNDIVTAFTTQANLLSYPENYGKIDAYEKAIDRLNSNPLAALIYKHWSNIKFLRNCELGMGLYGDGNVLGGERHFSLIEDPNPPFYYGVTYSFKRSLFDLEAYKKNGHNSNFEAFADVIKGYPVIAPLEEETIFMLLVTEKGNQRGNPDRTTSAHFRYLIGQHWSYNYTKDGKWRATSCTLNSDPNTDFIKDRPAIFKSNPADKTLSANITGVDNGQLITAVPIPFTAAAGGKWKGGSFSTNLNSSQTLQNQIQNLQDELTKENAYSFSRDNAIFDNWNESPYSLLELPVSYMGLVPEVGNTFGNTINKSKRDDTK